MISASERFTSHGLALQGHPKIQTSCGRPRMRRYGCGSSGNESLVQRGQLEAAGIIASCA